MIADETTEANWGRAFLTPSLPEVWDASVVVLDAAGIPMQEVATLADSVLGTAGFSHRAVMVPDRDEGAWLATEAVVAAMSRR